MNTVKVWRLHPRGSRIERADPKLAGDAPLSARKYCGPYMLANGAGFQLYSPVDVDLAYDPEQDTPWTVSWHGETYGDDEVDVLRGMSINHPHLKEEHLGRRTKVFLSSPHYEPLHTIQIWTGCVFQTPPGWSLWIRSPVNRDWDAPYRIQEAILETDWLWVDVWLNVRVTEWNTNVSLRKDGPPLAHIIPIPRESYGAWDVQERLLAPDDRESQTVFDWWADYNWEKYHARGEKDPSIYHRRRRQHRPVE